MTREELTAQRFASQLQLAKQNHLIETMTREWTARQDVALNPHRERLETLREEDQHDEKTCFRALDWLPFQPHDFVTCGDGDYYEVEHLTLRYSSVLPDASTPPANFVTVQIRGWAIKKSGVLARWLSNLGYVSLHDFGGWRKADIAEQLCLRRALKQRMKRRLEGGD